MKKVNCPTCNKSVCWNNQSLFKPFCSKRCKIIDLGNWATESYSITNELAELPTEEIISSEESCLDNKFE